MSELPNPSTGHHLVEAYLKHIRQLPNRIKDQADIFFLIANTLAGQSNAGTNTRTTPWQDALAESVCQSVTTFSLSLSKELTDPTERLHLWRRLGISNKEDFWWCITVLLYFRANDALLDRQYQVRPTCATPLKVKRARREILRILRIWLSRKAPLESLFDCRRRSTAALSHAARELMLFALLRLPEHSQAPEDLSELMPLSPMNPPQPPSVNPDACGKLALAVILALRADVKRLAQADARIRRQGISMPMSNVPGQSGADAALDDEYGKVFGEPHERPDDEQWDEPYEEHSEEEYEGQTSEEDEENENGEEDEEDEEDEEYPTSARQDPRKAMLQSLRCVIEEFGKASDDICCGGMKTSLTSYALFCFAAQCFSFRVEDHFRVKNASREDKRDKTVDRAALADALRPIIECDPGKAPQVLEALSVFRACPDTGRWGDAFDTALTASVRRVLKAPKPISRNALRREYAAHIIESCELIAQIELPGDISIELDRLALEQAPWRTSVLLWMTTKENSQMIGISAKRRRTYQHALPELEALLNNVEQLLSLNRNQSLAAIADTLLELLGGEELLAKVEQLLALRLALEHEKLIKQLADRIRQLLHVHMNPRSKASERAVSLPTLEKAFTTLKEKGIYDRELRTYRIMLVLSLSKTIRDTPARSLEKTVKGFFTQMYALKPERGPRTHSREEWEYYARRLADSLDPYKRIWTLVEENSPLPKRHPVATLYRCLGVKPQITDILKAAVAECCPEDSGGAR